MRSVGLIFGRDYFLGGGGGLLSEFYGILNLSLIKMCLALHKHILKLINSRIYHARYR